MDYLGEESQTEYINDWKNTSVNLHTNFAYTKYRITVTAENELGPADEAPAPIAQYSGDGELYFGPEILRLLQIIDEQSILIEWEPNSLSDRITKYTIHVWNDLDRASRRLGPDIPSFITRTVVTGPKPNVMNYISVVAHNKNFESPSSQLLLF